MNGGELFPYPLFQTIHHLLAIQTRQIPDAVAIAAPGRIPLRYGRLGAQVDYVVHTLNQIGIGPNDRVAIVLPNGPEMAVTFLAVAAGATSAPLNPAFRQAEFDFYLSDLNAKALIVQAEIGTAAREVARARGIPILELSPAWGAEAGIFMLRGHSRPRAARDVFAQPGDVALVLHTSGTTSRPRIVPLTHSNICTSAHNHVVALELAPGDCCLNVMPLFHIHGLISALLSSLLAGATVVLTPGFNASRFFEWMGAFRPTWYTAAPIMHQAVLTRAGLFPETLERDQLRFIRSAAASLRPQLMSALEDTFQVPVIESYGMTEACAQITSNPLPPRPRKPGSVGLAAGPEVAIMNGTGSSLPPGEIGEIMIRGKSITPGYENNSDANLDTFTNGWFRTGDQGYMDEDGYLFITGRLKEIINRGGEKIAPREVDEVLMSHPAVVQAAAFAVPHHTLGEDLAAAVMLGESTSATERELRQFASGRLADYKIPSRIIVVREIPKGPTGKLQRRSLAQKLAGELKPAFVAPRNPAEDTLAQIWARTLGVDRVGTRDNFFALGGDSLRAARVVAEVRCAFGVDLELSTIFQSPTITQLADFLTEKGGQVARDSLVLLQNGGSQPPVFCLPGMLGNVFTDLGHLALCLGPERPVYGFQDGLHNPSQVPALAAHYLDEIRLVQPQGPYFLVGVCSGGTLAFEMAQLLQAQGRAVALLAMVEPTPPSSPGLGAYLDFASAILGRLVRRFGHHARRVSGLDFPERRDYLRFNLKLMANLWALRRYLPSAYPGRIHLFITDESLTARHIPWLAWCKFALGGAQIHKIPGTHDTITGSNGTSIREAHIQALAEQLRTCIKATHLETPHRFA